MKNREIAKELREMADILELEEVEWKPRAYREAARKIENLSQDIEKIYKEKGKKGLEEIPSIGKKLAEHIADYIDKGEVKKWRNRRKKSIEGLHKLLEIEGLGPKKIKKLSKKLEIESIKDLKEAAKKKQIRQIKGFGEKSEQNILKSLTQYEKGHERILLGEAWELSREVVDYLKEKADIQKIDIAGSIRRMKETIGDIDVLVVTGSPKKLMDAVTEMPNVTRVLVKGKTKTTVVLKEGLDVDVRTIDKKSYGAALQYFTGSKDHGIALRKIAQDKGYKLSEYGVFKKGRQVAGKTEKDVYKKLGLDWIPPELRENRGEIEAAKKGKLPKLVKLEDVKGDLQMHTNYSDGQDTIRSMAKKAKEMGYDYIAITDHSQSEKIANGMDEKQIKRQWGQIGKAARAEKIKILKGAEVSIKPDGRMDYPDKILKKLDIVLAAVHSRFKSGKKEMTERILKALDNKYVNILAHPTGRQINKREGYDADYDKIFEKCKKKKVALEINCNPLRLDLNDKNILAAKEKKVKFSFGTDAHTKGELKNMRFGVGQARRGWLEKKDIINTMTYSKLMKFLKK